MAFDTNDGAVMGIIVMHTADPARAKAFYSRLLGWEEVPDVAVGPDGFFMKRRGGENPSG